ncbi:MAG: M15 family metallopeptidase [Halioglobus sp.]
MSKEAIQSATLLGQTEGHLVSVPGGHLLQKEVALAFTALQRAAQKAGFELAIASSFRSFERQRSIWNAKAAGQRAVHDDSGCAVDMSCLSDVEKMHAILRYSALPGASRHHWGTDMDVYDASAVAADYSVQLSLQEVAPGGVFDALHCWLDDCMKRGESFGFFRPYAIDRGGVAPERWHLSYAPTARQYSEALSPHSLKACWDCLSQDEGLLLQASVEAEFEAIFERYITVPDDGWAGE